MAFTFTTLKSAIQDYTQNTETTFTANLARFILNAEERILKEAELSDFRKNSTGKTASSVKYLSKPSDFLAPFSLSYTLNGSREFVEYKDVSFVQMYNPNTATQGAPKYYAQFDVDNILVGPTPDVNYVVELHYLYRPASLTAGAGSGTTWLSQNGELSLLYGALVEAYIFMKGEPDVMQQYNQRFNESMIGLKMLGEAKETTQEYRVGKVVRPKQ